MWIRKDFKGEKYAKYLINKLNIKKIGANRNNIDFWKNLNFKEDKNFHHDHAKMIKK